MYTQKECSFLIEASESKLETIEQDQSKLTETYGTYEHAEVHKLTTSEAKKDDKAKIKSQWRDSEVYRLEETYSLLNLEYDPRNFQKASHNKKDQSYKRENTQKKEPIKNRISRQELMASAASRK